MLKSYLHGPSGDGVTLLLSDEKNPIRFFIMQFYFLIFVLDEHRYINNTSFPKRVPIQDHCGMKYVHKKIG